MASTVGWCLTTIFNEESLKRFKLVRKTRLAMIKTKSFKVYNSTLALLEEELNLGKQTSFCSSLGCHLGGRAARRKTKEWLIIFYAQQK